jgi:hypothetical protein
LRRTRIDYPETSSSTGFSKRLAFVEYTTRAGEEPPDHTHGTEDEIFYNYGIDFTVKAGELEGGPLHAPLLPPPLPTGTPVPVSRSRRLDVRLEFAKQHPGWEPRFGKASFFDPAVDRNDYMFLLHSIAHGLKAVRPAIEKAIPRPWSESGDGTRPVVTIGS